MALKLSVVHLQQTLLLLSSSLRDNLWGADGHRWWQRGECSRGTPRPATGVPRHCGQAGSPPREAVLRVWPRGWGQQLSGWEAPDPWEWV